MKVTVTLPDDLIDEVRRYSKGKNITESLFIVLKDWLALRKIKKLDQKIENEPFKFKENFSADKVRSVNRYL